MIDTTTATPVPDYSPVEFQMKLEEWRQKARDNQLTIEEMREAILFMRQGRVHAAQAKAKRASTSSSPRTIKEKAAAVDSDSLLGDLGI